MPVPPAALTRRRVLGLAAGALLVGACAPAVTAAPGAAPGEPDPLLALVSAARDDAARATATATALPASADALALVASVRTSHADALAAEVDRAAGGPTTTAPSDAAAPSGTASPSPAAPAAWGSLDEARAALALAAGTAGALAVDAPAYRAGLLGSVAAACTAAPGVL